MLSTTVTTMQSGHLQNTAILTTTDRCNNCEARVGKARSKPCSACQYVFLFCTLPTAVRATKKAGFSYHSSFNEVLRRLPDRVPILDLHLEHLEAVARSQGRRGRAARSQAAELRAAHADAEVADLLLVCDDEELEHIRVAALGEPEVDVRPLDAAHCHDLPDAGAREDVGAVRELAGRTGRRRAGSGGDGLTVNMRCASALSASGLASRRRKTLCVGERRALSCRASYAHIGRQDPRAVGAHVHRAQAVLEKRALPVLQPCVHPRTRPRHQGRDVHAPAEFDVGLAVHAVYSPVCPLTCLGAVAQGPVDGREPPSVRRQAGYTCSRRTP